MYVCMYGLGQRYTCADLHMCALYMPAQVGMNLQLCVCLCMCMPVRVRVRACVRVRLCVCVCACHTFHTRISPMSAHTHIYHVCTQLLRGHSGKRCNLVSLFHDPKQILKSGLYKNGGFVISCVDLNIYSRVERTVSLHRISPEPYICTVYNPMCGDFPAKNAVCTPYIGWPEPYIYTVYDRIFGDFYAKNTVCTLCIPIHVWFWPGMGHADF